MYIILSEYLQRLKRMERQKPVETRRPVPEMADLAQAAGVHHVTLSYWVNNHVKYLNLAGFSAIIADLRRRGFDTQVSDILAYMSPEEQSNNGHETPD